MTDAASTSALYLRSVLRPCTAPISSYWLVVSFDAIWTIAPHLDIMATRHVQRSFRELTRVVRGSSNTSSSSSSRSATASSSAWTLPSQARSFASTVSASPSSAASNAPPSAASSRTYSSRNEQRTSPTLGTNVTGDQVLSHLSSVSSDLLGSDADIALRAVTHESYLNAREGHNRRLAFVGRRSLKLFTTLFLHSRLQAAQKGDATHVYVSKLLESPSAVDSILSTHRLGDKVGRDLGLEKVMRWTPAVSDGQLGPREIGLFKVRGVAVEALIGAIYHQKGALEASKFFHKSILPSLLQDGFPSPVPGEITEGIISPKSEA